MIGRRGATAWVSAELPSVDFDSGRSDAPAEPAAERARRVPFAVLIIALLGGGLCALLVLNTVTAANEVKQRDLDSKNATLNDREQQLSREVAALQAPDQLASAAAKLGLVPADSPAFIRINPDGSVTVLGKPAPATPQPVPAPPAPTPAATTTTATTATTTASPGAPVATTPATPATPGAANPTLAPAEPGAPPTQTPTPTVTLPGGPR